MADPISPYLDRPLRTLEQARADLAQKPLRRYYITYLDRDSNCEVDNVWARNADDALAVWAPQHAGRGIELFRKVSVDPNWDAVWVDGKAVARRDWEALQRGAKDERVLHGGPLPTRAQVERNEINEGIDQ